MLFHYISFFAILASALAVPTSPPTYSTNSASSPIYNTNNNNNNNNNNPSTTIRTLHTEVYHWTAAMNATRDSYASCTTDEERALYKTELNTQFKNLQQCVDSAQTYIQRQEYTHGDDDEEYVRDCVQEIKYTGQGLIPILGHDVVAPLLIGVVKSLNGLLGVLLPLIGGVLQVVFELLGGLLDLLF